jgi:hypothetical protein
MFECLAAPRTLKKRMHELSSVDVFGYEIHTRDTATNLDITNTMLIGTEYEFGLTGLQEVIRGKKRYH